MTTGQTEAQRLAAELLKGKTFPAYPVMPLTEAAALLLRQDELLNRALEAMEEAHDQSLDGMDFTCRQTLLTQITAIRAHREAK